jgi:hypothetical protein
MRDKVSPYIPEAIETVVNIMRVADKPADRLAAAKLLIAYYAGQPPQFIDHTTDGKAISIKLVADDGGNNQADAELGEARADD